MPDDKSGSAQDTGEDDVVQNLRRQVSDAQKRIKAADDARKAEAAGRVKAETRAVNSERARFVESETAIDNAIHSHETLLNSLEKDLADAIAAQDPSAQAKAQRNMTTVQTRLDYAKGQKAQYEAVKKAGGPNLAPQPDEGEDPRLAPYSPTAKAWIKRNPRFLEDEVFKGKVLALHEHATKIKGFALDSAEYFDHIEKGVGIRPSRRNTRSDVDDLGETTHRGRRSGGGDVDFDAGEGDPISEAGDVEDDTGTSTGGRSQRRAADSGDYDGLPHSHNGGGDTVTLTRAQEEVAQFSYPDEWAKDPRVAKKLYAENLRSLKREGRLGTGH